MTDNTEGEKDEKPKSRLDKLADAWEVVKKLIGLLSLIPPLASWYDPTFFGLLELSLPIAEQGFKYAAFGSVMILAYLLITHWGSLKKPPKARPINLRRNLLAAAILIPVTFISIDMTAVYLATHPQAAPANSMWRRWLLIGEYVAFVCLTVQFVARIALRIFPQVKPKPEAEAVSVG